MGKIEEYGYMQIESQHSENFETCVTCGKSGKESEIKKSYKEHKVHTCLVETDKLDQKFRENDLNTYRTLL